MMTPFQNPTVEEKFKSYPPGPKQALLTLRELVFDTAQCTPGVGEIEETLKWGEPAFVTSNRAGSTVRIDWKPKKPDHFAVYFICSTGLVETFRTMFPNDLEFEGNRAITFRLGDEIPENQLRTCIAEALTYHLNKRRPDTKQ